MSFAKNVDKNEFIKRYNELKSSRKMAKVYNVDKGVILSYAKKIGYRNEVIGILTEKDKENIVNAYEYTSSSDLAKKYNVSRGQITKVWYDNKLKGKFNYTYPFDYNYFKEINTPDKAYFLGFLAADGNVERYKSNKQATIRLSLSNKDIAILKIFKNYLYTEKPINIISKQTTKYISYIATLELSSDSMANDLKKYNIIPRKTYVYEPFILDDSLMSHYFRGYFDGDGCITCSKDKLHTPSSYDISYCGFIHNLSIMKNYFDNIGIKCSIIKNKQKNIHCHGGFGTLSFVSIENKYKFIKYIYKDCRDIYLARKKFLSDCFLNSIEQNYSNKQNKYNEIKDIILNKSNK